MEHPRTPPTLYELFLLHVEGVVTSHKCTMALNEPGLPGIGTIGNIYVFGPGKSFDCWARVRFDFQPTGATVSLFEGGAIQECFKVKGGVHEAGNLHEAVDALDAVLTSRGLPKSKQ